MSSNLTYGLAEALQFLGLETFNKDISMNEIESSTKLERAGFTRTQAETQVQVIGYFMKNYATKLDAEQIRLAIQNLEINMNTRFKAVDARFDSMDSRFKAIDTQFDGINSKFDGINSQFEGINHRFDGMSSKFEGVNYKLDGMNSKFEGINYRFDGINHRFDGVNSEFRSVDARFDAVISEIKNIPLRTLFYIFIAAGGIISMRKLFPGFFAWLFS